MAHTHNCKVCGVQVAICSDDSCLQEGHANAAGHHNGGGDLEKQKDHYCSIHHPDPEYHVAPTPPLKR